MSDQLSIQESRKRAMENVDEDEKVVISVVGFFMAIVVAWFDLSYRVKEITWSQQERRNRRTIWMDTLMNDRICREQLCLDKRCFEKLCSILQSKGGLVTTRYVTVKEIVAMFLHVLAHDLKNRTIQATFAHSGETISRQFHVVLQSLLKLGKYYIKPCNQSNYTKDAKWNRFEGVIGALNRTHIKMTVPFEDRSRY